MSLKMFASVTALSGSVVMSQLVAIKSRAEAMNSMLSLWYRMALSVVMCSSLVVSTNLRKSR
jgi:hypothetical protein